MQAEPRRARHAPLLPLPLPDLPKDPEPVPDNKPPPLSVPPPAPPPPLPMVYDPPEPASVVPPSWLKDPVTPPPLPPELSLSDPPDDLATSWKHFCFSVSDDILSQSARVMASTPLLRDSTAAMQASTREEPMVQIACCSRKL